MKMLRNLFFLAAFTPFAVLAQMSDQPAALPEDFAFTRLIDQRAGSQTEVPFPKLIDPKTVVLLAGNQVILFMGTDALFGLRGEGLKIRTIPKEPMEQRASVDGYVKTSEMSHFKDELGGFSFYRDKSRIAFIGINRAEDLAGWSELEWRPAPVACYRNGALLGIWDTTTRKLRSVMPDEAAATIQPASLKEAVTKGLPSPPRNWTDTKGRTIQARVTVYDPGKQTITIEIAGKPRIKDFPLLDFSPEDRAYVIVAHNAGADLPEHIAKQVKENLR